MEMIVMGVLQESCSDGENSIVLVPVFDGAVCFCVDSHKVNAVAKFDAYPMPHTVECWITGSGLF